MYDDGKPKIIGIEDYSKGSGFVELSGKKDQGKIPAKLLSPRKNSGRVDSWTRPLKTKTYVLEVIDYVTISSGFEKSGTIILKVSPRKNLGRVDSWTRLVTTETQRHVLLTIFCRTLHIGDEDIDNCHNLKWFFSQKARRSPSLFVYWGQTAPCALTFG